MVDALSIVTSFSTVIYYYNEKVINVAKLYIIITKN